MTDIPHFITEEEADLISKVEAAALSVVKKEIDILRNGRVEGTFTSYFANAIADTINQGNIRSEPFYNKHLGGPKILDGKKIELDVAVHERNVDTNNLVAIELETANSPAGDDLWKVKGLTRKLGPYAYKLGLYIVFGVSKRAGQLIEIQWFKDGELLPQLENALKAGQSLL